MGMDVDYVVEKQHIEELEKLLSNQPHGEREAVCDDIIKFVKKMDKKYGEK